MSDLNMVVLQGRITGDATLRCTRNGKKVADFTIAVNRTRKTGDGKYEEIGNFFRLSTFVNSENFAKHLVKGQQVIVEGYLKQDRWEQDDGQKRSQNNIGISRIHLVFGSKKKGGDNATIEENEEAESEDMILDGMDEDVYVRSESPDFDDMDIY